MLAGQPSLWGLMLLNSAVDAAITVVGEAGFPVGSGVRSLGIGLPCPASMVNGPPFILVGCLPFSLPRQYCITIGFIILGIVFPFRLTVRFVMLGLIFPYRITVGFAVLGLVLARARLAIIPKAILRFTVFMKLTQRLHFLAFRASLSAFLFFALGLIAAMYFATHNSEGSFPSTAHSTISSMQSRITFRW